MKRDNIFYYAATGLLTLLMGFSVYMYIFDHESVKGMFKSFGYPKYIIYPYAFAKIVGVIAIWQTKTNTLKEWAYAGFFFAFILAFFAHYMISDGEQMGAFMAIVLLLISYYFNKRIKN